MALLLCGLAACNSSDATLGSAGPPQPSAAVGAADAAGNASGEAALGVTPAISPIAMQSAAISSDARVQFAPIVGSTVESIAPLSRRLSERAAQRGVVLVRGGDTGTTHVMKGYFSAISDNGQTTVIYVWDVLDPAGNRLHRIQGQEPATGAAGEGWQGVPLATMEAVADRTIDQLAEWLAARQS
jgi:hypothetical protein